jgi:FKBP-type peptidyl-prolyl cis-trans isomerase
MGKVFLIGLAAVAFLLSACGGGGGSTTDQSAQGESEPFRIPVGQVSVREDNALKFKANGLVGAEPKPIAPEGPPPYSLASKDLIAGVGVGPLNGETVTVQYVAEDYETGKKYESSWDEGRPFTFKFGSGAAIAGFEQGIDGMEVGGRRELVVPPGLNRGGSRQKGIPSSATVIFVVDLLAVGEGS